MGGESFREGRNCLLPIRSLRTKRVAGPAVRVARIDKDRNRVQIQRPVLLEPSRKNGTAPVPLLEEPPDGFRDTRYVDLGLEGAVPIGF